MNPTPFEPLVHELRPAPDPEAVLVRLAAKPYCLFLDSALREPTLGRYSFLTADPFEVLTLAVGTSQPFDSLRRKLGAFSATPLPDLPPFQGGAAGLLSYDLSRSLERIPAPRMDEFPTPAMVIGLYDVVLAFDHAQRRAWVISQGFPETEPSRRERRAKERMGQFLAWLQESSPHTPCAGPYFKEHVAHGVSGLLSLSGPQYPVPGPQGLVSNFSEEGYCQAVQQAIDYIHAGDIFQVNFAQRLLFPANGNSLDLYLRLRNRNAATFAAYFDMGEQQIVSASPERLLSIRNRQVEARPIKGTRRRTSLAEADLFAGDELMQSEKDRAENIMIVDLLRNDLSRVCRPDSVRVSKLCGLESYQFVQHLVSVVNGELQAHKTPLDAIEAAFPGGSITGAPKVRAMEIIAELEPTARGPYCGSLGYIGFDGTTDFSILIRTIIVASGWWQLPVGGGIVAQSNPRQEYEETWQKATGMLRALV
ncbi:MAG: anthranilate synthase component I family protein [Planctomycetales bacterium]|nr:anthranilate synthase component I family protein [Planctomycetales bacterium]